MIFKTQKVLDITAEGIPQYIKDYFYHLNEETGNNYSYRQFIPYDDDVTAKDKKVSEWFIKNGVRPTENDVEGEEVLVLVWW